MISDRDVWRAARLMIKRYGADAVEESTKRADDLLREYALTDAETWMRISDAVYCLQERTPALRERNTILHRVRRPRVTSKTEPVETPPRRSRGS